MSICQWKKCHTIALVRGQADLAKAKQLGWNAINGEEDHLDEKIIAANHGHPVQVILNSVGNFYWDSLINSLDEFGRMVIIGAKENFRDISVNLFNLYRANQDIIGINTVALDFSANAKLLDELKIGFEDNKLKPLALKQENIFTPDQASLAYQKIITDSAGNRIIIKF